MFSFPSHICQAFIEYKLEQVGAMQKCKAVFHSKQSTGAGTFGVILQH